MNTNLRLLARLAVGTPAGRPLRETVRTGPKRRPQRAYLPRGFGWGNDADGRPKVTERWMSTRNS